MAPLGYVYKAEEEFSPQSAADEEPDSSLRAGGKFRKWVRKADLFGWLDKVIGEVFYGVERKVLFGLGPG